MTREGSVVCFVAQFKGTVAGASARAAILRTGSFRYRGRELKVTRSLLGRIKNNFDRFKRAGEIPLDYDHGTAVGKTIDDRRSAGWLNTLSIEHFAADGDQPEHWVLFGDFALNPPAAKYVENGEYRFLSAEWDQDYFHPEAQEDVGDYLQAVALTNRPFVERLPGMVLMSSETEKILDEMGEGRTARGSAPPESTPRAIQRKGHMTKKVVLSQYGGTGELEMDEGAAAGLTNLLSSLHAQAAKVPDLERKIQTSEATANALSKQVEAAEADKKMLTGRMESLEAKDADREFDRIFNAAKSDPSGIRATETERTFLKSVYLSHVAAKNVDEFEKYMKERPVILSARPSGVPSDTRPAATSAEAKFMAAAQARAVERKITFTQAARQIATEQPDLQAAYETEMAEKSKAIRLNRGGIDGPPSGEVV